MKTKYFVMVMEAGNWVENGDGVLTLKQAERIAREIRKELGVKTAVADAWDVANRQGAGCDWKPA